MSYYGYSGTGSDIPQEPKKKDPEEENYGLNAGESRTTNVGGKDYTYMNAENLPQNIRNQISRDTAYASGMQRGNDLFYNDPDMKMLRKRREDLSNGYDGQELGALRETANRELQGQRSSYLRSLQSKVGKSGVGGARAAAMGAAADAGFANAKGDQERKIALDNANLKRQGVGDLQDFIMRQKYGVITSAIGEQGLDVADRTGIAQAKAARESAKAASEGGGGGMCFLTTAMCEHYGLPDDCEQLQTMRAMRDTLCKTSAKVRQEVLEYYKMAKEIDPFLRRQNRKKVWKTVRYFIEKSTQSYRSGDALGAYGYYRDLVDYVKQLKTKAA